MHMLPVLAHRIRERRKAGDMSQTEFAHSINELRSDYPGMRPVTQRMVTLWERGECDISSKHLAAVARVLGVASDWLLGLSDELGGDETDEKPPC